MHRARLELTDGTIRYHVDGSPIWAIPVSTVRLIGETTNDHGPFLDDYALCFVTTADCWYEASFYAEGRDEFLASLSSILGCELVLRLVGSTDYDSNVIWPPDLAGSPMLSFTPVEPRTWIGRLIGRLMGLSRISQRFTDAVLAELRRGPNHGDAREPR